MNVNEFMCGLIDELTKKSFIGVEICKSYSKSKKSFVFVISAGKNGKLYTYSFEINENYLDYNSIEEIVNWLLIK